MVSPFNAFVRRAAVSLSMLAAVAVTPLAHAAPPGKDPTVVKIAQGTLAGAIDPEHEVLSFKGIPYARPPVGELRWRAPVAASGWSGVRQATTFGNICPQGSVDIGSGGTATTTGSEDCLYLNVYTPVNITRHGNVVVPQARPVMVWIHGGAWVAGTGNTFDPSVLAPKGDVVVVTINYRFGPLAYLAQRDLFAQSPDAGAGSLATLDQILALKWVRKNIREFGGNPENVTIFGLSGGGFSVCSLAMSPQAEGLFDRGISQSGPCVSPSAYKTLSAALAIGDQFTTALGCNGVANVPACLRSKTPEQLIAAAPPPGVSSGATWSPVVDGVVMPQQPLDALRSGSFNQVPIIQSTTADEISVFTPQFLAQLPPTNPIAQGIIGALVGAQWLPQINQIYPPANYPTAFHYFVDVVTDATYSCNAWRADMELSKYTPTYAYEVNDKNLPPPLSSPIPLGAYHGAEMLLMQQLPEAQFNQLTNAQKQMSNLLIEQFTQFARTGHPTALLTLIRNRAALWPRFNRYTQTFFNYDSLNIGLMHDFAEVHHCDFWNQALFGGN